MTHKENHHQMAEGSPEKPKSPNKQLSDSDTSDKEQINPIFKTSEEERHYGTIPGSALVTQIALSHPRVQANPTVERGPSHKVKVKKLYIMYFIYLFFCIDKDFLYNYSDMLCNTFLNRGMNLN